MRIILVQWFHTKLRLVDVIVLVMIQLDKKIGDPNIMTNLVDFC